MSLGTFSMANCWRGSAASPKPRKYFRTAAHAGDTHARDEMQGTLQSLA
jgi:hypothetical protein